MVGRSDSNILASKKTKSGLTAAEALDWFEKMSLIRRFEERAEEAYEHGKIGGFLHLYIGEEAIAVGATAALREDDDIVTHYRDHGYILARGVGPKRIMAELYGKSTGVSKGKGGSMHMADLKRRLWGGYAVVGGHVPLAVGLALAIQYRKESRIVACFLGDGATNTGVFYTGLNIAAVWKLPLIVIVENNQYGMGTAVARASAVTDLYKKACAFNMPAVQIDGNDVLEVRDTVRELVAKARSGSGPQLIEALTYRYRGHSMGDPQRYRTKAEVEAAKGSDPIVHWQQRILSEGLAAEADLKHILSQVDVEVDEAIRFAEASPLPEPSDLYADVLIAE